MTPTRQAWADAKQRCTNPASAQFKNYGARGISMCERWQVFADFLADMGEKPAGTSLDRIDNDGDYAPGNCRWATAIEQRRNQRRFSYLEFNGERLTVEEWAHRIGRHPTTLYSRIRSGYPTALVLEPGLLLRGNVSPIAAMKERP